MKETIEWASSYLASHGYTIQKTEEVQMTPWSEVIRFVTDKDYIYLKKTPPQIAIEVDIIELLHNQFHVSVAKIISHNPELNCFLMHDAGKTLREILKKQFDVNLACKAVEQFTAMQLSTADHVDLLIKIGVPDWRLEKIPFLFEAFLLQKNILIADGVSENEIAELKSLMPTVTDLCQKLTEYPIKQTIVQPDFNDNNTLINSSQQMTIIDLGEISITHPFFSVINFLFQMKKHHGLKETDNDYQLIKDACLKKFNNVAGAFEIANKLWLVYGVIAYYRLMVACGVEKVLAFQPGKLRGILQELYLDLKKG